jgi:hypothetical protein
VQWNTVSQAAALVLAAAWTTAAAQLVKVEAKPPMYTIVSSGSQPRAPLPEPDKALVGYGTDETLLHQPDGNTHDVWWSAASMGAVLNALEKAQQIDGIYVSRFYNWHAGAWHGAYTQTTSFPLNDGAPDDAVALVSKTIFVPLFEKLLADGTLIEYQIDVQAEHTEAPNTFWIRCIAAKAEGLDKLNDAIAAAFNANPLFGPTFSSAVNFAVHRDYLYRTDVSYR